MHFKDDPISDIHAKKKDDFGYERKIFMKHI